MKFMVFFLVLALYLTAFCAAETYNLTADAAVELALTRNLSLKQSGISLQAKERSKKTAWNVFLPGMALSTGLTAKHGIIPFNDNTPSTFSDEGNTALNAGLNISLPLNLAAGSGVKTVRSDYEAGLLDYESARKKLERDVRKRFYNILASEISIEIQLANIDLAQKRYEQVRTNYNNGLASELDILTAEVTLASLQPTYNSTLAAYETLILLFKNDLGISQEDDVELEGELTPEFIDLDAKELIEKYASSRLDIRSLDKQIEVLELTKTTVTRNLNSPTLNLGYNYGISLSNSKTDITKTPPEKIDPWTNWLDLGTFSLSLQWKFDGLIPGSKGDVQIQQYQDRIDSLKVSRDLAWQGAQTEISTLVKTLQTNRLSIEANTSRVELARKSYELIEEAYNFGTRELLDVKSAQNDYLSAQQQLLLANFNYVSALLDLEYAINVPMDEMAR